ncbi:hypothetical protein PVK06_035648 [Gossypium arboreum]|uniref:Uncharacterized protein n=1 Tax=Gossypium arboreum TaxID=29729 RepID=A0ABR0NHD1_GOSAR|nr:hypothetical protein PVK06_035648 [Gossypium arboreum]
MGETMVVINYFIMKTLILLILEDFRKFLKLPSGGESNEKGTYNPTLKVRCSYTSELNVHDRALHLTWISHQISKQWIDCFHSNRRPDLALILFNDITKNIGKELSSTLTLPFGMYLSYTFTCLNILTNVDPSLSIKLQTIRFDALHCARFKLDPLIGNWIKSDQPNP